MKFLYSTILLISLIVTACSKNTLNQENTEDLDSFIKSEMIENNIPSLSYCIVKGEEIVLQNSFGVQEYTTEAFPAEDAIYLLASISKTITAVALMQLYENGQLDLEADINDYLPFSLRNPYFPNTPITTKMLLTHTSSLSWPTNNEDPNFNTPLEENVVQSLNTWVQNYLTIEGNMYQSSSWKNYLPGEHHQYSNIGGAVLGLIVESISAVDFNQYCKQNIFEPLEMHNSGFRLQDVNQNHLVTPIHDGNIIPQYSVAHYPASMLKSSLKELTNFVIAIINEGRFKNIRILESNTINEMLTIQIPNEDQAHIWQQQSTGWIGHIGGYWGVTSSMDLNRSNKVGVIILTNTYGLTSIYPEGKLYKRIHQEAEKYFD